MKPRTALQQLRDDLLWAAIRLELEAIMLRQGRRVAEVIWLRDTGDENDGRKPRQVA